LGGQLQFQLLQQEAELGFGLGIAGERQLAAVGGRQVHRCCVARLAGEPQFSDWVRGRGPTRPDGDDPLTRIVKGEGVVRFAEASDDPGYVASPSFRKAVEISGMRSGITVPLRSDDALLGAITVYRQEVRPFSDKQIALLQSFAAQAVAGRWPARPGCAKKLSFRRMQVLTVCQYQITYGGCSIPRQSDR